MTSDRRFLRAARGAAAASAIVFLAGCPVPTLGVPRECVFPEGESLVSVTDVESTIRLDIRYATANNFTGDTLPGYEKAVAALRPNAAAALARVQRRLRDQGLGLKIYDAYRPIRATRAMVLWAERTGNQRVLNEGYVARTSNHNRGNTVDLTLVRLSDGAELNMGTPYDTFSEAAHTANATGEVAQNRQRLVEAMAAEGFRNYDKEWWHFTLGNGDDQPRALDVPLRCFDAPPAPAQPAATGGTTT